MQIDERVVDDVTILDLKGKMTLGEGDELLKDKINSLASQGHKKIVLNLEAVPYIDSAGLGEIVRTYTSISRQGGKLKLLNVSKRIYDLLVITKLVTIFDSYEGEAEAVKSFAASSRSAASPGPSGAWTRQASAAPVGRHPPSPSTTAARGLARARAIARRPYV